MTPSTHYAQPSPPLSSADADADFLGPDQRIGVFAAAARHWGLVLVAVLAFGAAGVVFAALRKPTYTAESRLSSAHLDVSNIAALPGALQAGQGLAAIYSRAITASAVVNPVAAQLHASPGSIRNRLSATPVPTSPLVRVMATGTSARSAIDLSNRALKSLVTYAATLTRPSSPPASLVSQFRTASLQLSAAQRAQARAQKTYNLAPTPANRASLDSASATTSYAQLRQDTLRLTYQQLVQAGSGAPAAEVSSFATSASSDRTKKAEIAIFIGVLAGLIVGLAAATMRANRLSRRFG